MTYSMLLLAPHMLLICPARRLRVAWLQHGPMQTPVSPSTAAAPPSQTEGPAGSHGCSPAQGCVGTVLCIWLTWFVIWIVTAALHGLCSHSHQLRGLEQLQPSAVR